MISLLPTHPVLCIDDSVVSVLDVQQGLFVWCRAGCTELALVRRVPVEMVDRHVIHQRVHVAELQTGHLQTKNIFWFKVQNGNVDQFVQPDPAGSKIANTALKKHWLVLEYFSSSWQLLKKRIIWINSLFTNQTFIERTDQGLRLKRIPSIIGCHFFGNQTAARSKLKICKTVHIRKQINANQ